MKKLFYVLTIFLLTSCETNVQKQVSEVEKSIGEHGVSNFWKNAIVYFLLTDRFNNGNKENDLSFDREKDGAVLRSFEGGDLKGITLKLKDGYFQKLGVNALWMTPIIEQIRGHTDEGTGKTWAYHGYWARDWTQLDPNFGTEEEFAEMVDLAHDQGIRVLMDVVINHTGPVTDTDPVWPEEWVRTTPPCNFKDYKGTVECTLVENLPDIRTESNSSVDLPPFLIEKWRTEGRLEEEIESLDNFFDRTGYPRAPRFYIIKWFRDWVRKYGLDGFRIDTAKHTEAGIWEELEKECSEALEEWKSAHPEKAIDDENFYMVGEVYNFFIEGSRDFDYGDQKVDFYKNGFESLINFSFKGDVTHDYESIFNKYDIALNQGAFEGVSVLNYVSSHDDGSPFDNDRSRSFEAGTKLLLCPGGVQIYYGDETARPLIIEGTQGDATLRSFMNWDDLENDEDVQQILTHWQKLGRFRHEHLAVGAGKHTMLQQEPYIFKRTLEGREKDRVLAGLDLKAGSKKDKTRTSGPSPVFQPGAPSGRTAGVSNQLWTTTHAAKTRIG